MIYSEGMIFVCHFRKQRRILMTFDYNCIPGILHRWLYSQRHLCFTGIGIVASPPFIDLIQYIVCVCVGGGGGCQSVVVLLCFKTVYLKGVQMQRAQIRYMKGV